MTEIKGIRALTESAQSDIRVYRNQEFLVVPVVAIIEGVRFGANQTEAELGLIDDIAKYPYAWDNKPLVLGHPQKNKVFVSANSIDVLGEYSFGFTNATYVDGKKLKMEAWIDLSAVDYASEVQDIIDKIEADEIIEVSVGFTCDVLLESGIYQGKEYNGIWKNMVPDHLAFLLDEIGACSIKDGCGVPRINSKNVVTETETKTRINTNMTLKTDKNAICACETDTKACSCQDNKTFEVLKAKNVVLAVDNSIVMEDLFSNLYTVLKENVDKALWLITATSGEDSTAVYEIYDENSGYYMMKGIRFNMDGDGNVELIGEPFPVRLMTKLIKMEGKTMSQAETKTLETTTTKEDKVETQPTEQQPQTTVPTEKKDEVQTQAQKAVTSTQPKILSRNDAIATMSAEDQAVVNEALRVHETKRTDAIKLLSGSDKCKFSADYLKVQSLDTLENMITLAGLDVIQTQVKDDYSGRSIAADLTVQSKPEDGSLHGCVAAPKVFAVK